MKILLILTSIFFFTLTANGQEKKETDYFKFTFSLKQDVLCIGDSTEIFAEITNISNAPMVIDAKELFFMMRFVTLSYQPKEDSVISFILFNGMSIASHPPTNFIENDFIILQPNETYKKSLEYKFNNSLFTKTQKYKMQLFYGQYEETKFKDIDVWNGSIESNEVIISIKNCS